MGLVFAAAAFLRFYRLDALPLGFHHDEALDSIAALEIWTKGKHPIFFPQQGSREPLMIYLESLSILALGATRMAARLAQALVGTFGVAAAWLLFRHMFGRRVALLAAACTAVSFWQMFESRLGLRAISQPLVETLCLLFLWRALLGRRWLDALLAGAFAGATLYTYTAARALPILLIAMVLWQAATAPSFVAKQWRRMLAAAATAVAVFAPLGIYAIRRPQDFFGRSLQVNLVNPEPFTGAAVSGGVGQGVLRTLGMFSLQGDSEWKYNIGGLPVFDWPMSALFYGGLLLAIAGLVAYLRTPRRERPPASPQAFVLLWLMIMLLPGALSDEAPHFLRTIGIIPAVFVFPGLALSWLIGRWRRVAPLAAIFLVGEGAETGYRYFEEWAHAPDAYYAMQADAAGVAQYLARLPQPEPVLFSSEYPGHPTLLYLAPKEFASIRWFNGREGMAFPTSGRQELYVFTARYQPGFLSLTTLFPASQVVSQGRDPAGGVAFQVFRGSPMTPSPERPLVADVGGLAELQGASFTGNVRSGGSLDVQEFWRAVRPGTPDIRAFLHLVDAQGHLWAQADGLGYYAEDWQPGDGVLNDQHLEVPVYAPPVPMQLQFGLYSAATGQQLPVREASGASAGTQLSLGSVQVWPGAAPSPDWRPPHATDRPVAPGLSLAGFELPQASARAGDSVAVNLFWRVSDQPAQPPPVQLAGADVSQSSLADLLPPGQWPVGVLEDRRQVIVPATTRAGSLALSVGGVTLGEVRVTELPRDFSAPPVQRELRLPVGDFASLLGYTIERGPDRLRLSLVWQDRVATPASYKVFVHVLDERTQVIAQRDDFPQAGAMPTNLWAPDQVIADTYEIPLPGPLPPGAQLEAGMYEPGSGRRVAIGAEDRVVIPLSG